MYRILPFAFTLLPITAFAEAPAVSEAPQLADGIRTLPSPVGPGIRQDGATEETQDDVLSTDSDDDEMGPGRNFLMEVGFRGRFVSVPRTIMDIWFFNENDPGWAYTEPRPNIRGYTLGLEFVVKGESANGIFYFDYFDSQMQEGYWDDVEEPADHLDGDYLRPSDNLGLIAIGANYGYEVHMVRTEQTNGYFGLSFLVGGGLGVAAMVGQVDQWVPDDNGNPSYILYLEGEPPIDEKRIPPIYPMVDINASLRFNFGDRAVFRVEGGLHTLIYYGASLGIMF